MSLHKGNLKNPDFILLFVSMAIMLIGLIMVLSSSSLFAYNSTENSYFFFYRQLKWAAVGIVLGFLAYIIPYKYWKNISGVGIIATIILLLMVEYSSFAVTLKGSTRWLEIWGISIQPSEIAKLTIVVFFSYILYRYHIRHLKDIILPLFVLGVIGMLILKQPDLGTTIVIGTVCAIMLLQTELPIIYFILAVPLIGIPGYYYIRNTEYQWNRILGWLYPWEYAQSFGYQQVHAQIAFGTGGLFGIGIGRSTQKYGFLPENYTDTIFAVIGEEFGFFGSAVTLLFFIVLISRGYIIARECPDRFGRLLAFGITSLIAVQTVVNLSVVTGLCPVTGITLPLVSYGGSSLVITMIEIGILLNISRSRNIKHELA